MCWRIEVVFVTVQRKRRVSAPCASSSARVEYDDCSIVTKSAPAGSSRPRRKATTHPAWTSGKRVLTSANRVASNACTSDSRASPCSASTAMTSPR